MMQRRASILCLIAILGLRPVQAQLAVTEVMSWASITLGSNFVTPRSDFWELTNFGSNTVSLAGYSFTDRDSVFRVTDAFTNCFIGPRESIIFMRSDAVPDRQGFFNWWGATNLSPALQVRTYPSPGFDAGIDAVQLFDNNGRLVDRVDFGSASRGKAFISDPETGQFGIHSAIGLHGAFKAVLADDVGSPGRATDPVPLTIIRQPVHVFEDAGVDVELSVFAIGLPRPQYEWYLNDSVLVGARGPSLTLSNVQPHQAGEYKVRLRNGLEAVWSDVAILTVNTNPLAPVIISPVRDTTVFDGQRAQFSVKARAYPAASFQWQRDGVDIAGATGNQLSVPNANLAMNGTVYSVRVSNSLGSTNVSAKLYVMREPKLRVTEVMAAVAGGSGSGHTEWFELTNLDTNTVDLTGYRFSDRYSFELSFQVTNFLVVEPGESIIFTERLSSDAFREWWGGGQLPPALKIVTYNGIGFDREGDQFHVWNAAATDPSRPFITAQLLESSVGYSLEFYPPLYDEPGDSIAGENGAFRAINGGDIGSPGYLTNPPPRFVHMQRTSENCGLVCRVVEGKHYTLLTSKCVPSNEWEEVGRYEASAGLMAITLPNDAVTERFFQLREDP